MIKVSKEIFIKLGERESCSVVSDSLRPHGLQPTRLLSPWNFPGKSTGVGCHFLLKGTFPTQGSNLGLPHCRQMLYYLSHQIIHKNKCTGIAKRTLKRKAMWTATCKRVKQTAVLHQTEKSTHRFKMNIGPETVKLLEENIVGEHLDHQSWL